MNTKHVAHLASVAIDYDGFLLQGRIEEMRDPSLVFGAKLSRPGNARHPQDHGGKLIDSGEIVNILVGSAFRAAIRRMKVQRLRLRDPGMVGIYVVRPGN